MFVSGACTSNLQFVDKNSMAHVFFVWVIYWEFVGLFCTSAPLEYIYIYIWLYGLATNLWIFRCVGGQDGNSKVPVAYLTRFVRKFYVYVWGSPLEAEAERSQTIETRKHLGVTSTLVLALEHVALRDPTGRMIMVMILWSSLESEQNIV